LRTLITRFSAATGAIQGIVHAIAVYVFFRIGDEVAIEVPAGQAGRSRFPRDRVRRLSGLTVRPRRALFADWSLRTDWTLLQEGNGQGARPPEEITSPIFQTQSVVPIAAAGCRDQSSGQQQTNALPPTLPNYFHNHILPQLDSEVSHATSPVIGTANSWSFAISNQVYLKNTRHR
jgi:hypothetical protein